MSHFWALNYLLWPPLRPGEGPSFAFTMAASGEGPLLLPGPAWGLGSVCQLPGRGTSSLGHCLRLPVPPPSLSLFTPPPTPFTELLSLSAPWRGHLNVKDSDHWLGPALGGEEHSIGGVIHHRPPLYTASRPCGWRCPWTWGRPESKGWDSLPRPPGLLLPAP